MSLPSQEVLDDINELITEITGFQKTDENFTICERYCLSHVVHHTYPFVNKSTVRELVNSYVSRFYGHGYFKISQELSHQLKEFLSNEKLFEKNPQYDIQWSLLSLLCSLSAELTTVKKIPELLPIDDEEKETDNFNWAEYLTEDLPEVYQSFSSSDSESQNYEETENNGGDLEKEEKSDSEVQKDGNECELYENGEISFDERVCSYESELELRKECYEEFLRNKNFRVFSECDEQFKGDISEKFDLLLNSEGIIRKSQILTEFNVMEGVLYEYETGERILLKKGFFNPALRSLTQDTLCSYLESLQPYFNIIRDLKDFDTEIMEWKYPAKVKKEIENQPDTPSQSDVTKTKKIPNVLYMYNVMLNKALEPFRQEVTEIVNNLENYSLITMDNKLEPYLFDITTLYSVHISATKNWRNDPNWMSSVRVLCVLHNAIMNAQSSKMSFMFLNLFLHCFQVYLDTIDSWISSMKLNDPNDEFVVTRSEDSKLKDDNFCTYQIRNYQTELENSGVKRVEIVDFIGEKMVHVGQSLEILKRLNRFVTHESQPSNESSFQSLVKLINSKIASLGKEKVEKKPMKPQEKKKSVFTMNNPIPLLEKDVGGGDSSAVSDMLVLQIKMKEGEGSGEKRETVDFCRSLISENVKNPFFKMTFNSIGIEEVRSKIEEAKAKENLDTEDALMIVKEENKKSAVYPFHKIISEAFYKVFSYRVSDSCAVVKQIVVTEFNLLSHFSLLRSILLFNDAYIIQPFILALFTQPIIWDSSYSLTLHLRECVKNLYKEQANALTITLDKEFRVLFNNILEVIDALSINYEVQWPLTLIFTPEIMEKYNKIFRVALKLKWAHWVLSGLHFEWDGEEQTEMSKSSRHRVQLLRFWFLSALGRINSYFMTQMLPWEFDLNSCSDLKDIIKVHSNFVDKVYSNCLLTDKLSEGRDLIFRTLIPLCMDLSLIGNVVSIQKLPEIEKVFGSCQSQLSRLMSSLEKE